MQTLRLDFYRMRIEKILITLGMAAVEGIGFLMLMCGIFGVKIF